MERRLAAILAADVVGYSRQMNSDETGTLSRLDEIAADIIRPAIDGNGGRIIKEMGDGYLVEFASVTQCVACAIQWQQAAEKRAAVTETDAAIRFRIGINLGEVISKRDDVFGDGVNIAVRLEALAEPGGICLSGSVHDQVSGQLDYSYRDLGFRKLKNIPRPVRIYSLNPPASDGGAKSAGAWPYLAEETERVPISSGGCLCGSVRYEVWGKPAGVGYCHCRFCQLALGAPVNAWAAFEEHLVKFFGEPPSIYESSDIAYRGFCGKCGTSIFTVLTGDDGTRFYSLRLATLDDPENYPPSLHFGVESKLPWLEINDDLPRICTADDPVLSGLWKSVGQPESGPSLGPVASRSNKDKDS